MPGGEEGGGLLVLLVIYSCCHPASCMNINVQLRARPSRCSAAPTWTAPPPSRTSPETFRVKGHRQRGRSRFHERAPAASFCRLKIKKLIHILCFSGRCKHKSSTFQTSRRRPATRLIEPGATERLYSNEGSGRRKVSVALSVPYLRPGERGN